MKKNIFKIIFLYIFFIVFLWLAKPLRTYLTDFMSTYSRAELLAGIIVRIGILSVLIFLLKKWELFDFNGLLRKWKINDFYVVLVPILFFLIIRIGNYRTLIEADLPLVSLFFISVLFIGLVEEILFRGMVLPLFIELLKNHKSVILWSVIISSLSFGVLHYANLLLRDDASFLGTTTQVLFALSIGVIFAAIFLRIKNIIPVALFHSLFNFTMGDKVLKEEQLVGETIVQNTKTLNYGSLLMNIVFSILLIGIGVYLLRKVDESEILEKLNIQIRKY